MGITILIAISLFLVFLFIKFITPIPPFEPSTNNGLEVNFGFDQAGMGDNNSMEPVKDNTKTKTEPTSQPKTSQPQAMMSSDEASNVSAPPVKNTNAEVKIEEPKPDQNLLDALNKKHTEAGSNTGDGNTNTPGNQGDPNGTLNSNVYSTGGGTGLDPKYRLKGSGRKMIRDIAIYDNSQETGIVAVEIMVDRYGKITKAEPVLIGSTTTSSLLWKKAKDGLMNQKLFNESSSGEEARGTIYINFTVR
jgi:hypothetical protein